MEIGDYRVLMSMDEDRRAWALELMGRFGWPAAEAVQQAYFFGVCRRWVYDYRTGELLEEV